MTFNITPIVSLTIINAIAFVVYFYCLIKLTGILRKIIEAKRASQEEIQISGRNWKASCGLISVVTLPFVGFVAIVLFFVWVGIRMI